MPDKPLWKNLSRIKQAACLLCLLVCAAAAARAETTSSNLLCRPDLSITHRAELAEKLRVITGWATLDFDSEGALRLADESEAIGGSASARELLHAAISGSNLLVFEDASNRVDVVFARVVEGRWTKDAASKPPVFLIQIDFADFSHVIGDKAALAAFNEGWAALHEIVHVVHGSADSQKAAVEVGECESLINVMRRECGLAVRAEYFFDFLPGQERGEFTTRFVRLAFDVQSPETNKKKRYWIVWDASVVGGLEAAKQIARK